MWLPEPLAQAFAAHTGQLTFGQYMAISNQCYYAQDNVIGLNGDFITAPEISQLFGEMIGVWIVRQWQNLGQPAQFQLIELGPGRGTLMADALRVVLKFIPAASIQLYAVETSPALRALQAEAWANHLVTLQWVADIESIPAGISIIIANEFLDALPVEQYQWDGTQWLQLYVSPTVSDTSNQTKLSTAWLPLRMSDDILPNNLRPEIGDIYESPLLRHQALKALAIKLKQYSGAALIIDYGFAETAFGDTLQAVKNHQPVELLVYPGAADLTSHVNFGALKNWAMAHGLETSNIISQSEFLHSLGIAERLKMLQDKADMPANLALLSGYQRLTAPSQMGALFKAIEIRVPKLAE